MDAAPDEVPSPRLLMPSSHADLRVTWHGDRGVVVSLWHNDVCAASAPLSIPETARLAGFLVDHVAAWAVAADDGDEPGAAPERAAPDAHTAAVPSAAPDPRHLRPAPEPGAGQRAGAAVDEVVAAGGTAMRAAVEAARRAWRERRA